MAGSIVVAAAGDVRGCMITGRGGDNRIHHKRMYHNRKLVSLSFHGAENIHDTDLVLVVKGVSEDEEAIEDTTVGEVHLALSNLQPGVTHNVWLALRDAAAEEKIGALNVTIYAS